MRRLSIHYAVLAPVLAFWPVWIWYSQRMLDGSDEPWGLAALLVALCVAGIQRHKEKVNPRYLCVAVLFTIMYSLCFAALPALVRGLIAVLVLAMTVFASGLSRPHRAGVLGLLILSLPIVASLQFYAGYPVRLVTGHLAAQIISLLGYPVTARGTLLQWAGEYISVDAPCSGIKMLWSGLFLCFSSACSLGLGWKGTMVSYSVSVVLIFFGNVLRATVLFFSESRLLKIPEYWHGTVGLVIFSFVALGILVSQHRIKRCVC